MLKQCAILYKILFLKGTLASLWGSQPKKLK